MRYGKTQIANLNPVAQISGAYTSGRPIGTLITLAMGHPWATGILKSLLVADVDNQKSALTVLFFSEKPVAVFVDNTAFTLSAADAKLVTAKVDVAAADYETIGGSAFAQVAVSLGLRGSGVASAADTTRSLYALVVAAGTPTFTGAGNLQLRACLLLD